MCRKSTKEEFVVKARLKHGDKWGYDNFVYVNSKTKGVIDCLAGHGTFEQTPNDHLSGKGCLVCGTESMANQCRSNKEEFVVKARLKHGDKWGYDNFVYVNSKTKGVIDCLAGHGTFEQTPDAHINQHQGCPVCGTESTTNQCRSNKEEFVVKARLVHEDKWGYDNFVYVNNKTKGTIDCLAGHGTFEQSPDNHLSGKGCPDCVNENEAECRFIFQGLLGHKFQSTRQVINWCGLKLELDGYCPELRAAFEYQGIQHYRYCPSYFHRDGKHIFMRQQLRDFIKVRECRRLGIDLCVIPYNLDKISFIQGWLSRIN